MKRTLRRFAVLGLLATLIDVGLLALLHRVFDVGWVAADMAALIGAGGASYVLHRVVTFQSDPFVRWVHQPWAFALAGLMAGALDVGVFGLLSGPNPSTVTRFLFAKAGAVGVAAMVRLIVYRTYLGRSVRHDQEAPALRDQAPGTARLSVVVPAYFEEDSIADTISRLRHDLGAIHSAGGLEIVVVDDGSTDGTAEAARRGGADLVVVQPQNQGKGAAVRAGMLAASGRTLAFTDADLAYSPDQLVGLLEEIEKGWDVVVGSRRHTETTTLVRARAIRELGGRVINLLTQFALLGRYRDTQCGIKAFRSDVAQLLFSHSRVNGFAFDIELFHLIERYRLTLTEVPVRVENSDTSTVNVVRDALRLIRDLFRIRRWARHGDYTVDDAEWPTLFAEPSQPGQR